MEGQRSRSARPFRLESQRSAGGQELQPSDVKSSTTVGARSPLAARHDAAGAAMAAGRVSAAVLAMTKRCWARFMVSLVVLDCRCWVGLRHATLHGRAWPTVGA